MSNENKTALTAEEKAYQDHINKAFIYDNPDHVPILIHNPEDVKFITINPQDKD